MGGRFIARFPLEEAMKNTEASLREDVSVFDMLAEYGAWAVVAGVVAEVAYALVYPEGKTWPQIWVPVIASALIAFGVIVEILAAGKATEARDELDRISNEKVSAAELKAAELENANLLLRKQLGPRQFNPKAFVEALANMPAAPVEIMYVRDDPESWTLALQISFALTSANWQAGPALPIDPTATQLGYVLDSALVAGGQPSGVSIVSDAITNEEFNDVPNAFEGKPVAKQTPALALTTALGKAGITKMGWGRGGPTTGIPTQPGVIRIVVAPKG